MRERIFQVFALFFLITAVYHFAGLFYPVNDSPKWRHALFIAINLFCAYGILKRPAWFVYLFFVLLLQQLYSHGSSMVNSWVATGSYKNSLIDLLVVVTTPLIFMLLVYDLIKTNRSSGEEISTIRKDG